MVAYSFYESDNRVRRYAETLARRGDQVDAISLRREGQLPFEIIAGVNVYRIQKRVRNEICSIHYLLRLLKFFLLSSWVLTIRHLKRRYDLVHVHSVPDFEVFAALIPKLSGSLVILDIHDIVPEFYASKFGVSERSLIFRALHCIERVSTLFADHVIISNHLWYETLTRRSVPPHKCTVIINYPDPAIFHRSRQVTSAKSGFVMCYPGTLNWHQGVDLAIKATNILRTKVANLRLLIIGDGPDRDKLRNLILQHHLEDYVTLLGPVPIEQVAEHMANIDLGVVPKRANSFGNEAFSTKILEFMAMNVPVVASYTRIDQYYFGDGLVHFFRSDDENDLAVQILDLVTHPEKRLHLRKRGKAFVRRNNWDVRQHEYLRLIDGKTHSNVRTSEVDCSVA